MKNLENLSEEEINDIFKIIEIMRENGNVFYEVKIREENKILLKNKKSQEILLTNVGIYEKTPPYKNYSPIKKHFQVARYLIEKNYNIGEF